MNSLAGPQEMFFALNGDGPIGGRNARDAGGAMLRVAGALTGFMEVVVLLDVG